jgi:hypothetical protein
VIQLLIGTDVLKIETSKPQNPKTSGPQ